ncbi:unnamed protein product [Triticum turgidum subsp. durum]|uniref:glutamine synthetase n=2 Tax=Triticum TaxID=4564 RepID=A0A9R0S5W9_TRITD|nr:unnamed protein product [Triticum turgidum subsp. durum]
MASLADLVNLDLSDCTDKIIVEYLWIGGSGIDIRSKARTVNGPITDASQLPKWNYDGSSTGQAPGEDSEVILYPQAIFKDPFRRGDNLLVMCDCYTPQGVPIPTNKRHNAAKIFNTPKVAAEETWYGIEQEYTLLQKDVNWPLGWPIGGYPGPQGPYYCAGAHTNYSTKSMREAGGYGVIKTAIEKLGKRHAQHIAAYGEGNERRLTGHHETADINTFKWGVADRGASIRVGRDTEKDGKGYFEDRRPASNMDPYVVTSMIAETTLLL